MIYVMHVMGDMRHTTCIINSSFITMQRLSSRLNRLWKPIMIYVMHLMEDMRHTTCIINSSIITMQRLSSRLNRLWKPIMIYVMHLMEDMRHTTCIINSSIITMQRLSSRLNHLWEFSFEHNRIRVRCSREFGGMICNAIQIASSNYDYVMDSIRFMTTFLCPKDFMASFQCPKS